MFPATKGNKFSPAVGRPATAHQETGLLITPLQGRHGAGINIFRSPDQRLSPAGRRG